VPLTDQPDEPATPPAATPPGIFDELPAVSIPRPELGTAPAPGSSDVINLIGGRQVSGRITEEFEDQILIELSSGNTVRIPRARVESILRAGGPDDDDGTGGSDP
jgi:hypothetical protein